MIWSKALAVICFALTSWVAFAADKMDLPDEELATESVTPIFEDMSSVKARNVTTDGRVEVGGYYGWALTEPIANVSKLGANIYYHTSEDAAWGVFVNKNFSGLSTYAKQLNTQFTLDFDRAPKPDLTAMIDYNLKVFYGKMSLSKRLVLNTHLLGSLSGGVVKYQHKTYPAVAAGIGQKFYFTSQFSLRLDLRLFAHNAPIPFKPNALKVGTDPVPSYNDFSERLTYTTVLDLGLSYIF